MLFCVIIFNVCRQFDLIARSKSSWSKSKAFRARISLSVVISPCLNVLDIWGMKLGYISHK